MRFALIALLFVCLTATAGASQIDVDNRERGGTYDEWAGLNSPLINAGNVFWMGQHARLDAISVSFRSSDPWPTVVELYRKSGQELTLLGASSVSIPFSDEFAFYSFPFEGLTFDEGEELAFIIRGHGIAGVRSVPLANSPYIHLLQYYPQDELEFREGYGLRFATYITPVPEPSTIVLALVAVVAFRMRLIKRT
jgi:hypothetical protein